MATQKQKTLTVTISSEDGTVISRHMLGGVSEDRKVLHRLAQRIEEEIDITLAEEIMLELFPEEIEGESGKGFDKRFQESCREADRVQVALFAPVYAVLKYLRKR